MLPPLIADKAKELKLPQPKYEAYFFFKKVQKLKSARLLVTIQPLEIKCYKNSYLQYILVTMEKKKMYTELTISAIFPGNAKSQLNTKRFGDLIRP